MNHNHLEARARQSLGKSSAAIYRMVGRALRARQAGGRLFVDVGCGTGALRRHVHRDFERYVGLDAVRYEEFPQDAAFHQTDLDSGRLALADGCADAVAAVETIEH